MLMQGCLAGMTAGRTSTSQALNTAQDDAAIHNGQKAYEGIQWAQERGEAGGELMEGWERRAERTHSSND